MLGFGFNKDRVRAAAEKNVQQGKLQAAISEYEKILKHDPKDLTIVNTIGDLYARLGQADKAVQCFKTVGESYVSDGFVPKAIAIYKKLTKIDPSAIDAVEKLGELYTKQGLNNDARAQLLLAAEAHTKAGDQTRGLNILRRVLELDPENVSVQSKLADLYVRNGNRDEAKKLLFVAAESLFQRGSVDQADGVLGKLIQIDPLHPRGLELRGTIALQKGNFTQAVTCLENVADLDSRHEALRSLLDAYLELQKMDGADLVARKLLKVHNDSEGVLIVAEKLMATEPTDAIGLYNEFAEQLLSTGTESMQNRLRAAISRVRDNITALEMLRDMFRRSGDTSHESEIMEMIAHAAVRAGDLKRASELYRDLAQLEPDNPTHAQNYRQLALKLGEDPALLDRAINDSERPLIALDDEIEARQIAASAVEESNAVELPVEKVESFSASSMATWESAPQSASQQAMEFSINAPEPSASVSEFSVASVPASSDFGAATTEFGFSSGYSFEEQASTEAPTSEAAPIPEPETTGGESDAAADSTREIDLSEEWEHVASEEEASTTTTSSLSPVTVEDIQDEITFYIAQEMWDAARAALINLEKIAPGSEFISDYRKQIEAGEANSPEHEDEVLVEAIDVPTFDDVLEQQAEAAAISTPSVEEPANTAAPEFSFAAVAEEQQAEVEAPVLDVLAPELSTEETVSTASTEAPAPVASEPEHQIESMDDFVLDLESSLGDDFSIGGAPTPAVAPASAPVSAPIPMAPPAPVQVPAIAAQAATATAVAFAPAAQTTVDLLETSSDVSLLDDLFQEFKEDLGDADGQDTGDPETHYNLGIAFKEMGLLDEAIGELQKVCQAVERGHDFPQMIQACTWLASCFVEKGVPEASFKWYEKALKYAKDDDTRAAIHYELACAYETAGLKEQALKHFMEVYATNIDFRDVGERIRALKS